MGSSALEDIHPGEHGEEEASHALAVRFTPEFKAEIVELCRRGDRSVDQFSKDLEVLRSGGRRLRNHQKPPPGRAPHPWVTSPERSLMGDGSSWPVDKLSAPRATLNAASILSTGSTTANAPTASTTTSEQSHQVR
ncbi:MULTISPECIES: transposase [unclassified Streptomyces]|uniref:transposase n=1 Tax=unclassified Streptomyces TaxID=2593676 RepID=UPI0036E0F8CD